MRVISLVLFKIVLVEICFELKNVFERFFKIAGNLKSQLQAWKIFRALDGDDGLPRYTKGISQIFLRQLVCVKAQSANVVGDSIGQIKRPNDKDRAL